MVEAHPGIYCDPCIAPLVKALNEGGVATVASCCGHGKRPGKIALVDGRELFILPDFDSAREADELLTKRAEQRRALDRFTPKPASTQPESPGNSGEGLRQRIEGLQRFVPELFSADDGEEYPSIRPHRDGDLLRRSAVLAAVSTQPVPGNSSGVEEEAVEKLRAAVTRLQATMFLTGSPPKDQDEALADLAALVDGLGAARRRGKFVHIEDLDRIRRKGAEEERERIRAALNALDTPVSLECPTCGATHPASNVREIITKGGRGFSRCRDPFHAPVSSEPEEGK